MRRTHLMARCALALALTFSQAALSGCDDEADPKTWVKKLSDAPKRTGAMQRLHRIFDETLASTNPPNLAAPAMVRFLDAAIPGVSQAFIANPDDTILRREAIEILAQSKDARAIDALLNALTFRAGNADSERVALRAAQALKEMAPTMPEARKAAVVQALVNTIDRAQGNGSNSVQIRYHTLGALGALHAREAVTPIARLLMRRLADQDISTARAAADALGVIGDAGGVDALVYGLYLNVRRQNAFPHCQRALARIGSQHAVPKLLATLAGQNTQVEALVTEYRAIPGGEAVPPGLVKSTAADVLREFAATEAVAPLLALVNNRQEDENVRGAAGEALAYTAISVPSKRAEILAALHANFTADRAPVDGNWSALVYAPRLSLIGDPSSIPLVLTALNNRAIATDEQAPARVSLLLAFASIARRANVADFDRIEAATRAQLTTLMEQDPAAVRAQIGQLDQLRSVISVARDCEDGDTACYIRKLDDTSAAVVRKAAYMIAWTTPEAGRDAARTALEGKLNSPDLLVRRSIMVALDALSPSGSAQTISKLQLLISSEEGQESKILSHLWAELLISRLRARATGGAPAAAATP